MSIEKVQLACVLSLWTYIFIHIGQITDYGRPEGKSPLMHGRKLNSNPKFLGTAEAYFVCHFGPKFDFFDLCLHWVSVVRGQLHHLEVISA